jgi:hypothetical protein
MARLRATYSGERRTEFLGCQLTPTERAEIEKRAAERGELLSDYARSRLLGGGGNGQPAGRRRAAPPEVRELAAQVARVGNNLNQLTLRANTAGQVRSEEALRAALDDLAAVWGKVLAL